MAGRVEEHRLACVRVVRGQAWIDGGSEFQDAERELARRKFFDHVASKGYRALGKLKETTEYDEQQGRVLLRVSAVGRREMVEAGEVFIAPIDAQPGDPSWQPLSLPVNGPIELKGPPAGRDRFA